MSTRPSSRRVAECSSRAVSISLIGSKARANVGKSGVIVGTVRNGVGVGARSNAATVGIAVGSSGVETVYSVLEGEDSALDQAIESTMLTAGRAINGYFTCSAQECCVLV